LFVLYNFSKLDSELRHRNETQMKPIKLLLCALVLCSGAMTTIAQQKSPVHPPDLALTAVGRTHHPIATANKSAQDYFDQGLTLVYAFNHEEAARSFEYAHKLDPTSPMPLWGIALAIGPNYNADVDPEREKQAFETLQKASKLAENSPQVERDYVSALATRFSGDANPDYKTLAHNYAAAMKSLSQKYPDDNDAATLYADSLMALNPWKLWTLDGKPNDNTEEIVAVLEGVLKRDPNHVGANHFYIHAVEASPQPERALSSARRLDTLVPEAGHLVHMPSHIYARTGFYSDAVKSNEEAAKVDRVYARKAAQQGSMYDLMYHSHNEHFLASAASMTGRYAEAKAAADAMASRLMPHAKMMPALDTFIMTPLWVDARFNKWDAILARPEPAQELPATHAIWRYTRTLAFAARGQMEKASAERDAFAKEVAAFPASANVGEFNRGSVVLGMAGHILDARIAAAKGDKAASVAHWREAVAVQDTLNYDEPPDWYYPVRESLGAALLNAGNPIEAENVFRDDLLRNPRNPRSLFGLTQALKAQNRDADAAWTESQFKSAWKSADSPLSLTDF
jgi:tetratricopeptide (TPR) repeat protein